MFYFSKAPPPSGVELVDCPDGYAVKVTVRAHAPKDARDNFAEVLASPEGASSRSPVDSMGASSKASLTTTSVTRSTTAPDPDPDSVYQATQTHSPTPGDSFYVTCEDFNRYQIALENGQPDIARYYLLKHEVAHGK